MTLLDICVFVTDADILLATVICNDEVIRDSPLQHCRPLLVHSADVTLSACTVALPRARTLHWTPVCRSSLSNTHTSICAHNVDLQAEPIPLSQYLIP